MKIKQFENGLFVSSSFICFTLEVPINHHQFNAVPLPVHPLFAVFAISRGLVYTVIKLSNTSLPFPEK